MQIGHKVSSRDRNKGAGRHHNQMSNISTRAADERRARALDGVAKYDGTGKAPTIMAMKSSYTPKNGMQQRGASGASQLSCGANSSV